MVLKCVSEERGREGGERERRGGERMGEEGREWREGGEREQRVDNKNTLVRVLCCWDSRGKQKTRQELAVGRQTEELAVCRQRASLIKRLTGAKKARKKGTS